MEHGIILRWVIPHPFHPATRYNVLLMLEALLFLCDVCVLKPDGFTGVVIRFYRSGYEFFLRVLIGRNGKQRIKKVLRKGSWRC